MFEWFKKVFKIGSCDHCNCGEENKEEVVTESAPIVPEAPLVDPQDILRETPASHEAPVAPESPISTPDEVNSEEHKEII